MRGYTPNITGMILLAGALMSAGPAAAQEGIGGPVGAAIDGLVNTVFFTVPILGVDVELIVIWMAAPMLLLTLYFGFVNVRSFRHAWQILWGKYQDDSAPGEISQFRALATALSGTVGLGNIAGVAAAIAMGGPGAAFWMMMIGLFAMTLKFTEVTLSVKYRVIHEDGSISGGPMHYLRKGLEARGLARLGTILAVSYAIVALPSILQIAQVNQAYSQFSNVTGLNYPWMFGLAAATLTGIVIFGGLRGISRVTSILVPAMAAVYVGAGLFILLVNITQIPAAVGIILNEALKPEAGIGAIIGAIVVGMRRAVYSSEAGLGSATIAHAAAKTREPVSEGMVALLEPFIDTVVICSMTALVIVVTGAYRIDGVDDIQMTSAAFNSVIPGFDWILAIAVLMFAFSTIISWAYYTSKVWTFLFGDSNASVTTFRLVYCAGLVPGAVFTVQQVFDVMDSVYFLMAVPNIIGCYIMAGEVRKDLGSYLARLRAGDVPTAEQLAARAQ